MLKVEGVIDISDDEICRLILEVWEGGGIREYKSNLW